MVTPRDYDGDGQHSIRGESSDTNYSDLDPEKIAEDHATANVHFDRLRALHQSPSYKPTGTLFEHIS